MKIILLGTGTSTGVPEVGCGCLTCQSLNPRDKRLRSSALLISSTGKRILIDCGPDFRAQARRVGLDRIDAILLTHEHYDHVYGLDDLRTIAYNRRIPIYGQSHVLEAVRQRMHYVFRDKPYPGTPKLTLHELQTDSPLSLDGLTIRPIVVEHGRLPIYGYRFTEHEHPEGGDITYITDMKSISTKEWQKVNGSTLLIINALRYKKPHPSHQSVLDVEMALASLSKQPKLTVLTHLSHHAPQHDLLERLLPEGLCVGYDFMSLSLGAQSEIYAQELPQPSQVYEIIDLDICLGTESLERWTIAEIEQRLKLRGKVLQADMPYLLLQTNIDSLSAHLLLPANTQRYTSERVLSALRQTRRSLLDLYAVDTSVMSLRNESQTSQHEHYFVLELTVHGEHSLQTLSKNVEPLDAMVLKAQLSAQIHQTMMLFVDNPLQNS